MFSAVQYCKGSGRVMSYNDYKYMQDVTFGVPSSFNVRMSSYCKSAIYNHLCKINHTVDFMPIMYL